MPPQRRLKPSERSRILGAIDNGVPLKDISNTYNVPYSTVKYTKKKSFERDADQHDLPRQGRPRETSRQGDARLYRRLKRHPETTWSEIQELTPLKKTQTRQRLLEIDPDFKKRQRRWRPYLTPRDALKRRDYEQRHRCWRAEDWANVWYSDECSIEIGKGEMRKWHWMHSGEQYLPENLLKSSRNHETVMIWAAMRADGRVEWRFCDEYYGEGRTNTQESYARLLRDVLPGIYEPGHGFLQDGASIHRGWLSIAIFEIMGIWVVEHPPYSPDLNPIEHLWIKVKEMVFELHPELKTMAGGKEARKNALKQAIKQAFDLIQDTNQWDLPSKLIASMPVRLQAVRKARGFQTKY